MKLAYWLVDMAVRLLPAHRRDWAEAMQAELAHITEPRMATDFAFGCLWTAVRERITAMKLIVVLGRLGVGLVTITYGAFFIHFLINAFTPSEVHNPYFAWLLPWQLTMGISHVAAGLCLIFWRPKAFIASCVVACLPALSLSLYGFLASLPHPSSYVWPFIPLVMLTTAAAVLWGIERCSSRSIAA